MIPAKSTERSLFNVAALFVRADSHLITIDTRYKMVSFGGFVLGVNQSWWGHRAEKSTLLYIVGIEPSQIPVLPLTLNSATTTVENLSRKQREMSPPAFSEWLVDLAARCEVNHA